MKRGTVVIIAYTRGNVQRFHLKKIGGLMLRLQAGGASPTSLRKKLL
jgi:hypothetical protein